MSGDGSLDGGSSGRGGEGVLGGDWVTPWGPGNVRTMAGGGEGGDSMFGMKSAKRFLALANGKEGRPKTESSEGMVGLTYGPPLPLPTGLGGDGALLLLMTRPRRDSGAGCRAGLAAAKTGIGGLGGGTDGQSGNLN